MSAKPKPKQNRPKDESLEAVRAFRRSLVRMSPSEIAISINADAFWNLAESPEKKDPYDRLNAALEALMALRLNARRDVPDDVRRAIDLASEALDSDIGSLMVAIQESVFDRAAELFGVRPGGLFGAAPTGEKGGAR